MSELREFWSNIENVRNAIPEDIQSDVLAYLKQITDKNAAIEELEQKRDYFREDRNYYQLRATTLSGENTKLRKALEEAKKEAQQGLWGSLDRADEAIRKIIDMCTAALGEGDKE